MRPTSPPGHELQDVSQWKHESELSPYHSAGGHLWNEGYTTGAAGPLPRPVTDAPQNTPIASTSAPPVKDEDLALLKIRVVNLEREANTAKEQLLCRETEVATLKNRLVSLKKQRFTPQAGEGDTTPGPSHDVHTQQQQQQHEASCSKELERKVEELQDEANDLREVNEELKSQVEELIQKQATEVEQLQSEKKRLQLEVMDWCDRLSPMIPASAQKLPQPRKTARVLFTDIDTPKKGESDLFENIPKLEKLWMEPNSPSVTNMLSQVAESPMAFASPRPLPFESPRPLPFDPDCYCASPAVA